MYFDQLTPNLKLVFPASVTEVIANLVLKNCKNIANSDFFENFSYNSGSVHYEALNDLSN